MRYFASKKEEILGYQERGYFPFDEPRNIYHNMH